MLVRCSAVSGGLIFLRNGSFIAFFARIRGRTWSRRRPVSRNWDLVSWLVPGAVLRTLLLPSMGRSARPVEHPSRTRGMLHVPPRASFGPASAVAFTGVYGPFLTRVAP